MTAFLRRILFVDNEESQIKLMRSIFARLGYDAECVNNAQEALKILDNKEFPLIITDLRMPEMDGAELCRRIRKIKPEAFIYAFSGYLVEFDVETLEEAGFDGHLNKPVQIKVLERAIEGAFEKIEQRKAREARAPR